MEQRPLAPLALELPEVQAAADESRHLQVVARQSQEVVVGSQVEGLIALAILEVVSIQVVVQQPAARKPQEGLQDVLEMDMEDEPLPEEGRHQMGRQQLAQLKHFLLAGPLQILIDCDASSFYLGRHHVFFYLLNHRPHHVFFYFDHVHVYALKHFWISTPFFWAWKNLQNYFLRTWSF